MVLAAKNLGKACIDCGLGKLGNKKEFVPIINRGGKSYLQSRCKFCHKKYCKKYRIRVHAERVDRER